MDSVLINTHLSTSNSSNPKVVAFASALPIHRDTLRLRLLPNTSCKHPHNPTYPLFSPPRSPAHVPCVSSQSPLQGPRKRGRPKGSKNKPKTQLLHPRALEPKGNKKISSSINPHLVSLNQKLNHIRHETEPSATNRKLPNPNKELQNVLKPKNKKPTSPVGDSNRKEPVSNSIANPPSHTAQSYRNVERDPKDAHNNSQIQLNQTSPDHEPKRKSGRPKGSKNRNKIAHSSQYESTETASADLTIDQSSQNWRKSTLQNNNIADESVSSLGPQKSYITPGMEEWKREIAEKRPKMYSRSRNRKVKRDLSYDWSNTSLRAPNGLPNSGPADLIQEMLPLVAKAEIEKNRIVSDEEKQLRNIIKVGAEQFASTHRSSGRLKNLKPFKLREQDENICTKCEGKGMHTCDYCAGYGFVDFGENAVKFYEEFEEGTMLLPKCVMGTIYHCPYCGGLTRERCIECLGNGIIESREPRKPGASRISRGHRSLEKFDLDKFLEKRKDRIEIGTDGLIILRAKKRGRKKTKDIQNSKRERPDKNLARVLPIEEKSEDDSYLEQSKVFDISNSKGSDDGAKSRTAVDQRMSSKSTSKSGSFSRSDSRREPTDFVNTTDYQVGRKLRVKKKKGKGRHEVRSGEADHLPSASEKGADLERG